MLLFKLGGDKMAYSGLVLRAIKSELDEEILNKRIIKIYQPNESEIRLHFSGTEKNQVLISVNPSESRLYLSKEKAQNPMTPPSFCMVLRKHLEGGLLCGIEQIKTDRIIKFIVKVKNEFYEEVYKFLFVEIMGKHSNIVLTDENMKIIDSIKRISPLINRVRAIMPGKIYDPLVISNGLDPSQIDEDTFENLLEEKKESSLKNFFLKNFTGFSPLLIEEISAFLNLSSKDLILSLNAETKKILKNKFFELQEILLNNSYYPSSFFYNGKKDFEIIKIVSLDIKDLKTYTKVSPMLDDYYKQRSKLAEISQKSSDLSKNIEKIIERTQKKLEKQAGELNEALDREKYKVYADLISANFHKIPRGSDHVFLENFYSENLEEIKVPLDIKLNPAQNAQVYYKKYSKLKTAASRLNDEIERSKALLLYLDQALLNIELAKYKEDLEEIRAELGRLGLFRKSTFKNKSHEKKYENLKSPSGFQILLGRNNRQNEEITLKIAKPGDTWFHIKEGPGAHVVIKNMGQELTRKDIEYAGQLALENSKQKDARRGEVVYTDRKFIKRHPSKIPGLVIYTDFKSLEVKL